MRKVLTLSLCLFAAVSLFAQTQKVTGMVIDAKTQEPLIGVTILELGTTNGIVTDIDGNFTLGTAECEVTVDVCRLPPAGDLSE